MNLTLSRRGDYVVRSAIALARAYPTGESRKIREVVAEMEIPQTFASQILADLVKANLATSKSGRDGGYRLARDPEDISLLEVVEAGEGHLRAERCALGEGPCRWDSVCPLHETWIMATEALRESLSTQTLADVAKRDTALEVGDYLAPLDSHRPVARSFPIDDTVQVDAPLSPISGLVGAYEDAVRDGSIFAHRQICTGLGVGENDLDDVQVTCKLAEPTGDNGCTSVDVEIDVSDARLAVGLDGALEFCELDPKRFQVHVRGTTRLKLFGGGVEIDATQLGDLVNAVTREFLLVFARGVEQTR